MRLVLMLGNSSMMWYLPSSVATMSEMQKNMLLEAAEVVRAVLMVNQAGEVASLAAAEGLLPRVASLAMGQACPVVGDAYPVGVDRQPEQVDPLGVRPGKESSLR